MKKLSLALMTAATLALPQLTTAEDIEVYVGNDSYRQGSSPKVLIIFDNSGSMRETETVLNNYDPDVSYSGSGSATAFSDAAIYFNRGTIDFGVGDFPEGHFDSRRFNDFLLGCETAIEKLNTVGYYTGYLMEYQVQGNSGSWQPFPGEMGLDKGNPVDCLDDITFANGGNGKYKDGSSEVQIPPGLYPYNNPTGKAKTDLIDAAYTSDNALALEGAAMFTKQVPVTLFKANYLRYKNSPAGEIGETPDRTRLEVAKEAISTLLTATPGVDFGMMVFNVNVPVDYEDSSSAAEGGDGGRVISKIQRMTDINRANLLDTVAAIEAETNTPLCESLLETKRYLAGEAVDYANKDYALDDYVPNTPAKDLTAETDNRYISPFNDCKETVYVILITDGEPTVDNFGDTAIKDLPGIGQPFTFDDGTVNYLPALAGWMYGSKENPRDINPNKDGTQNAVLFTIGFGDAAVDNAGELLADAANRGGGAYYEARSSEKLEDALVRTFGKILEVNSSFTAPSVASNNFDRTRSLDNVYYAMFLPAEGPRWRGNLKKLKLVGDTLTDKNNKAALNDSGSIDDKATTFWNASSEPDGNNVPEGGVAAMLAKKADRKLYTNAAAGMLSFERNNIKTAFDIEAGSLCVLLHCEPDATVDETIDAHLAWARGLDVDDDDGDDNFSEIRPDVFGDPLHSKPAVISYSSSDIRILVGTNAGFMHMFKDSGDTVDESWAFMPAELFTNIPLLRKNDRVDPKVYGVDGSPLVHFSDANGDGIVDAGDKVWAFFGLRRGGNSYYALDITNPDDPKLMWQIDDNKTGFGELGQSWSKPVLSYIPVNGEKPVLFFGAGYSTNKDLPGVRTEDGEGRGMFIVDAQTGSLIWRLTPDNGYKGKHSVAGAIAVMDSDIDGYTDRAYFADTGGSVWRVDMVGPSTDWTHYEFARLSDLTDADDRRFFYEPVVARTFTRVVETTEVEVAESSETIVTRTTVPFDAVVLGSGTRPNPLDEQTQDKLFMLKDMRVVTAAVTAETTPSPILLDNLLAITSTEPKTAEAIEQFEKDMTNKDGWYYPLAATEKSLSPATILAGVAYFTSYTPPDSAAGADLPACSLPEGGGLLYAFNLHYGTRVYNRLSFDVGKRIPDNPELFLGEDENEKSQLLFLNVNEENGDTDGTIELLDKDGNKLGLKTSRTYIYMGENQ